MDMDDQQYQQQRTTYEVECTEAYTGPKYSEFYIVLSERRNENEQCIHYHNDQAELGRSHTGIGQFELTLQMRIDVNRN